MADIAYPAVVTATSPLTIRPFGSDTAAPAKRLTTYTSPAINDVVAYVTFNGGLLVLGKWV